MSGPTKQQLADRPAEPVADHIAALLARGWDKGQIATAAGISRTAIRKIAQHPPKPTKQQLADRLAELEARRVVDEGMTARLREELAATLQDRDNLAEYLAEVIADRDAARQEVGELTAQLAAVTRDRNHADVLLEVVKEDLVVALETQERMRERLIRARLANRATK